MLIEGEIICCMSRPHRSPSIKTFNNKVDKPIEKAIATQVLNSMSSPYKPKQKIMLLIYYILTYILNILPKTHHFFVKVLTSHVIYPSKNTS
jgi:hypothetical protein